MSDRPPPITPQPVPTNVRVDVVPTQQGQSLVAQIVVTPVGTQVFFYDAKAAIEIGEKLIAAGKHVDTGIVIPRVVLGG